MNKALFLLGIFISGCTGHLSLKSLGCTQNTNFQIVENNERIPAKVKIDGQKFRVETRLFTGSKFLSSPEKFQVHDILAENGIKCNDVKTISISTKTTGWDNFIGLIPFVSAKMVIIEGELTHSVKDDDADKEESIGEPSS